MNDSKLPAIKIKYTGSARCVLTTYKDRLVTTHDAQPGLSLSYQEFPTVESLATYIDSQTNYEAELYSGSYEQPVSNELHIVPTTPPYQVQLAYLPKTGTLYLSGFQEVTFSPNQGQFRCDYNTGILEFNSANNGVLFNANYIGLMPASLGDLESKYLEIRNNQSKVIGETDWVNITYSKAVATPFDIAESIIGIPLDSYAGTITDGRIEDIIRQKVSSFQSKYKIFLKETIIKSDNNPYAINNQVGVNCDLIEPAYDGMDSNYIKLRYEPLISVERCELVYLGNLVRSYPFEWIQKNNFRSELRIVPKTGAFHLMGFYSGSYLFHSFFPRSTSMFGHFLPWIQVDYTAGWRFKELPEDLRMIITYMAAVDVLMIADGLACGGVASKSIDGVSESYTRNAQTSIFGYRIKELNERIAELVKPWVRTRMVVA